MEDQHKPTRKNPAIDEFLTSVLGIQRRGTIINKGCVFCRTPNLKFRDDLSRKEYRISGICQSCQDKTFKENDQST